MAHYYFLDESGDPGLTGAKDTSSHFVLALVQLAERAPLPPLARLRQTLHLSSRFEFKYYKASAQQKASFFQAIRPLSFRVRAVVIEKARLTEPLSSINSQEFVVEFISRLVLRASDLEIANDVLIIDGATPVLLRALRIRLSAECKRNNRVRPFRKIISGDSKREDGLQLADMIAGATRHYAMDLETEHLQTFAGKVSDLWPVPEQGK